MSTDIEGKLESAVAEVKALNEKADYRGFMIISKEETDAEFFQFAAEPQHWILDYPVIPANENTERKAKKIQEIVSNSAKEVREGSYEEGGLQADIDAKTDFVELSKEIIEAIWPQNVEIEIEVDG